MAVRPVRLDPFQRIVNVGWGSGAKIAVLQVGVDWFARTPFVGPPTLVVSALGGSFDLATQFKSPGDLVIVNPLSGDMIGRGRVWSYPPYIDASETPQSEEVLVIDRASYYVNTSLGKVIFHDGDLLGSGEVQFEGGGTTNILPFGFNIPFIRPDDFPFTPEGSAALDASLSEFAARLGATFAAAVVNEVLESHTETNEWTDFEYISNALVFLNVPKLKALLPEAPSVNLNVTFGASTSQEFFAWGATLMTYRGRKDFPAGPTNLPAWFFLDGLQGFAQFGQSGGGELAQNGKRVNFQIEPVTLLVSGDVEEL